MDMDENTDDGGFAAARSAVQDVRDPEQLARLACLALAGIDATNGNHRVQVLTELTHAVRAVSDAAERTAGVTDPEISAAMWRLTGALGTRLTEEPLPVLRGEAPPAS